jgi:hypothetical protein
VPSFTVAGVVAVAALWKGDGNELFKDKQYAEAMLVYTATLALLEAAPPAPAAPEEGTSVNGQRASAKEEEEAAELKVTCHCNIAACALNAGGMFAVAEEHCARVLVPGVGGLWPPVRRRTSPRRRLYLTFRTDRTARGSLDHQKSLFLKQVYLTETRYAAVGQTAGASVGLARSPLHRPGLMPS